MLSLGVLDMFATILRLIAWNGVEGIGCECVHRSPMLQRNAFSCLGLLRNAIKLCRREVCLHHDDAARGLPNMANFRSSFSFNS